MIYMFVNGTSYVLKHHGLPMYESSHAMKHYGFSMDGSFHFFYELWIENGCFKKWIFQLSMLWSIIDFQWKVKLGIAHGWWQQLHDKFVGQLSENGPHPIFNGSVTSTDICIIYLQIMAGIWYLERKFILKHSIFDI